MRVVASGGGSSRLIARSSGYFASVFLWAPDSRRLAVVSGRSLFVVNIDTGRRVTIDRGVMVWGFSFSPSGDQIAWGRKTGKPGVTQGGLDIYRASTRGGARHRLTQDRGSDLPVWGPRGIAFARFEPFTLLHPAFELWCMQPDGSGIRRISKQNLAPFAWSRDGRRLLTYAESEVDSHPYAVDPATGRDRPVTRSRAEVFRAAFSRDGRLVLVTEGGKLVEIPWEGGRGRILARRVDEAADWTR